MRRLLLPVVATVGALAVLIPLSVLATVALGVPARHWSGVHLDDIRWNGDGDAGGQVLGPGAGNYPYGIEDVTKIAVYLDSFADGSGPVAVEAMRDDVQGCVRVVVVRLDNAMFERLHRYGDEVCVVYSPNEGRSIVLFGGHNPPVPPVPSARPVTYWSWSELLATYWVLLTGFPLHIGAMVLLVALAWTVLPAVRRSRRASRAVRSAVDAVPTSGTNFRNGIAWVARDNLDA